MSQERAAYREIDAEIISGLVQILADALQQARTKYGRIDLDDLGAMLDMVRALLPDDPNVSFLRGVYEVTMANWQEAVDIFAALVSASRCLPRSRALLVYALRGARDPGWRREAEALSESGDPNTRLMVCSMIAEDDLDRAIAQSGVAGAAHAARETLEITQRLRAEAEAAAEVGAGTSVRPATATQRPLASEVPSWMNYRMRV